MFELAGLPLIFAFYWPRCRRTQVFPSTVANSPEKHKLQIKAPVSTRPDLEILSKEIFHRQKPGKILNSQIRLCIDQEICQNICISGFSHQKWDTLKVRKIAWKSVVFWKKLWPLLSAQVFIRLTRLRFDFGFHILLFFLSYLRHGKETNQLARLHFLWRISILFQPAEPPYIRTRQEICFLRTKTGCSRQNK